MRRSRAASRWCCSRAAPVPLAFWPCTDKEDRMRLQRLVASILLFDYMLQDYGLAKEQQ